MLLKLATVAVGPHGNEQKRAVQPPQAAIDGRRRPHGDEVAGTARGRLSDFGHDVSRLRQIQFGVDLRYRRRGVPKDHAGGLDTEFLA